MIKELSFTLLLISIVVILFVYLGRKIGMISLYVLNPILIFFRRILSTFGFIALLKSMEAAELTIKHYHIAKFGSIDCPPCL